MIFIALQFEHGVLRRALLALCDLQLVARFGKLALGVLGGLGGKVELFGKAAAPRRQLAQLACAAQNACAARDRAARHRARRGNDIAVERDHAERVRKFFGNFVGVGDIVHDQGVAQQIIDDIIVIFVVAHEFGRKPQSAAFFERAAGKIRFVARL